MLISSRLRAPGALGKEAVRASRATLEEENREADRNLAKPLIGPVQWRKHIHFCCHHISAVTTSRAPSHYTLPPSLLQGGGGALPLLCHCFALYFADHIDCQKSIPNSLVTSQARGLLLIKAKL